MKRRLKEFVLPVISGMFVSLCLVTTLTIKNRNITDIVNSIPDDYTYVTGTIFNDTMPILSYDDVIVRPYQGYNVNIVKEFYDEESKERGIIYYKDTYMQNTGVLYNSDNEFNVVSILDGEIIDIKNDDIMGYTVEIKHTDNLISSYEGLSTVYVKKGDQINKNTIIGKSGDIKLEETISNSLLFELIKDGHYINPEKYYDKKVNEV